ncbi:uncharacterized protein LOC110812964 [Carica papaya]|uniref:uncharacterized protein LOC110812964 n=1 Tax=Carica papaya TaxID=3649 RepID=UPI000B8CB529|nr:uncharacterized protein LOC110812964 [Carica papaya]
MAFAYKLSIYYHLRSSLYFPSCRQLISSNPNVNCCLQCNSSSGSSSPFTEKHSLKRYQRDQWVYQTQQQFDPAVMTSSCSDGESVRENDIALQLPELKKLLQVLREKRESCYGIDGNGERCGPGNVFLVGTGPGDPELLTLKAVRVIQSADLLLYDRLVSNDVLDFVGPDARLLYVGKTAGYHSRTQEEIHELLLKKLRLHRPLSFDSCRNLVPVTCRHYLIHGAVGSMVFFPFCNGSLLLGDYGSNYEAYWVLAGITAASGIAAELGIPLTHRGVANSVRFLTGHSRKGGTDPLFVAENAADPDSTLVVYMGLSTFPSLALKLMHHGLPPDTPAAAVERGTTPQQRTVFAELKDLASKIASVELISPTLIIIGKVVSLSPFWPYSSKEASNLVEAN